MAALALLVSLGSARAVVEEPAIGEKQVVLETSQGELVLEVFPEAAPRHVAKFLERVADGFYVGTAFHRAIPLGIIQGGDPLSKDPTQWSSYGTGGLFELAAEPNKVSHLAGTVAAVLVPGRPDSGGSQFFICVTDQTQLDGTYTPFARVVEGLDVVAKISRLPTDSERRLRDRVEITRSYLRERPPPEPAPFADTPAAELARYRVAITTDLGEFEIALFPDVAPEHVRQFLRFAELGIYQGTPFHRVIPGFVIQGGLADQRKPPLPQKLWKHLKPLKAEFSGRKHLRGTVSMARGDDPDSAMDSFFIVLEPNPHLDGKYTVFGEVVRGMETVDGISQVPTRGETPIIPIEIKSVRVRHN